MTARVLVVDDVPANVKLLEARLSAEYFDVMTAVERRGGAGDLRARRMRRGAARRDDARHGRVRGLPPAQDRARHASHPGGDGDRARSALRPGQGPGIRRRRFSHQAGLRRGADRARALAVAAQDDDRRVAHARRHLARDRHREPGARGAGRGRPQRAHPDGRRSAGAVGPHRRTCWRASIRWTWSGIRPRRCSTPPRATTT